MSNVTVDVAPGYYLEPKTVNVSFSTYVKEVNLNQNGTPPSISKYIGYDTLNPPNPFIATTQDGNGNVIYDGGFPKFYNISAEDYTGTRFRHAIKTVVNLSGAASGKTVLHIPANPVLIEEGDVIKFDRIQTLSNASVKLIVYDTDDEEILDVNIANGTASDTVSLTAAAGKLAARWTVEFTIAGTGNATSYLRSMRVEKANVVKSWIIPEEDLTELGFYTEDSGTHVTRESREASAFDFLKPVTKYALNCIDFIVDERAVRNGNRKILVVGDANSGQNYNVLDAAGTSFKNTFEKIAHFGFWEFTYKTRASWTGGYIDARLAELKQYVAVIFMSSIHGDVAWITPQSVNDFVTYRKEGGGLFFITDHGQVLTTIQQAQGTHSGFFRTANAIIVNFGAWFSGDYNRTPVGVGHLRNNYGDHPLYKNLTDADSIPAGGSESRVYVTSDPLMLPTQVNRTYEITSGKNNIYIITVLEDGTIESHNLEYHIVDYKMTFMVDGTEYDSGQSVNLAMANRMDIDFGFQGNNAVAMTGKYYINNVEMGTVSKPSNGQITITPNATFPKLVDIPVNDNDYLILKFTQPAGMELSLRIRRFKIPRLELEDIMDMKSFHEATKQLLPNVKPSDKLAHIQREALDIGGELRYPLAQVMQVAKRALLGSYMVLEPTHIVTVGSFNSPQHWYGFFSENTNGYGGEVSPANVGDSPIRDINSPVDEQLVLQLGSRTTLPAIRAVFIDDVGPLLTIRETNSGGVHRLFFSNGAFNVYKYLEKKNNQTVEIRLLTI